MKECIEVEKHDIINETDVKILVNTFYSKIREDQLLSDVFDPIVKDWEKHLKLMTDFWSTLLLYTRTYNGDPLPKHLPLPLNKAHFDRWLQLFDATIDELFEGVAAQNAKKRAASISRIMKAVKNIPQ